MNTTFDGVEPGSYYEDTRLWAQTDGIVNGVTETEFAPHSPVTREQMAVVFYNYTVYKGLCPAHWVTAPVSSPTAAT